MGEYKYGTNFTSVKVKYAPGGASSINLGWEEPQNPSKNSGKRHAIQDPFRSREGNRNPYETEDFQQNEKPPRAGQHPPIYSQQVNKMPPNPSYSHLKSNAKADPLIPSENYAPPDYGVNQNYFQNKEEAHYKPIDFPSNNYFRPAEVNYFKQPESSKPPDFNQFASKSPTYPPQGQFLMEKNFSKGQDVNYKEPERHFHQGGQEYNYAHRESPAFVGQNNFPTQKIGQPQRFGASNEGPIDAFSGLMFKGGANDARQQGNNFQVKNSVKVSNPPGGQSSIVFG
jgi:hypothetical protein